MDDAGHLLLRWPDAFSGYGLTPKNILDELATREWLWIDPMAPLKKVLDAQLGDGTAKVIRLERDITDALLRRWATFESCGKDVVAGTQPESAPQPGHQDPTPASAETDHELKQSAEAPKRARRAEKIQAQGCRSAISRHEKRRRRAASVRPRP